MEKARDRQGNRPSAPRHSHGRAQPFGRAGFPDQGLTSHGNPSQEGEHTGTLGHRKLMRSPLSDVKEPYGPKRMQRRQTPPEQTSAEAFYYLKQMGARTPMVVVLKDGETLHGIIEWYDHDSLKVNRDGVPNLLILKHAIKYLYKAEEGSGSQPRGSDS
jgi:sRNA-binding regulator protein Hfq